MTSLQNRHSKRVVAVLSAFQPSATLVAHCAELQPQVSRVIVVDDGSGSRADEVFAALSTARIEVARLAENSGIGHAINRGVDFARQFEPEFIITFDQDSSVPTGFVDALVDEYDRLRERDLPVGMVAPDFYSLTSQSKLSPSGDYLEAQAPIQSGLLMPLSAIDQLGPQREDFFIDLIDTEYFFRARRAEFLAVCVPGLVLPHGFGHRLYVHAFGRRLTKADGRPRMVAVSTPFRYYYRARNRVLLNRAFKKDKPTKQILRRQAINDLFLDFGVAVYSAKGKWSLVRVMWAGWRDGLRGRSGKIPGRVAERAARVSWRHPVETN